MIKYSLLSVILIIILYPEHSSPLKARYASKMEKHIIDL